MLNNINNFKRERKINLKNKKLMNEKILSYSPELIEGITKYNDANIKFTVLLLLTALCVNIPMISLAICILTIIYLIKLFQLIRFRNIKNIVNILSRDLALRGIYDKGKVEVLIDDFVEKYGDDIKEYKLLVEMVDKYEVLVKKIEAAIKHISPVDLEHNEERNNELHNEKICNTTLEGKNLEKKKKVSFLYKNEQGEIKKINRAIEFFEKEKENVNDNNTVILKSNKKGEDSKLTVYLYKKNNNVTNNTLVN